MSGSSWSRDNDSSPPPDLVVIAFRSATHASKNAASCSLPDPPMLGPWLHRPLASLLADDCIANGYNKCSVRAAEDG